jgi:hypothetical protein
MTISLRDCEELLGRSYALVLVKEYVERFDQFVHGTIRFELLSEREECFEHVLEVFEQDLRLSSETSASKVAAVHPSLFLKGFVLFLLGSRAVAENLCLVGWDVSAARSWFESVVDLDR